MVAALVVLVWVACAGFAAMTAHYRGLPVGKFALAGLLLGPAGLAWATLAHQHAVPKPNARTVEQQRRDAIAQRAAQPLGTRNDWRRHLDP